ncbi:MAG TPA: NAD(P)H-quinone oxidoreductase, partial [Euzebyales bacterium]|nr:NAD(P)H-quinone oxidoreductase [Euzebyales bacterium]
SRSVVLWGLSGRVHSVVEERTPSVRAVVVSEPGDADRLQIVDRPTPVPEPDEVLVAVRATSVNRPDVAQRQGRYPPPPGAGDILGLEVAGDVVEVGGDVTAWRPGDRVCGLVASGGYADYAAVHADVAIALPADLPWEQAGGLTEVFSTAYDNLVVRGRLRAGETALIHGVASGVGTAATQLAVRAGARVIGTASTQRKLDAACDLGAFAGIDYTTEDFVERARELTDGRGVDVILDMVGGPYLQRNLDALALEGRLVIVGTQGGTEAELSLWQLMRRRLTVLGSTLRARTVEQKAAVAAGMRTDVMPGFADGSLRVVVDRVFRLDDIAAAHRALEAGDHIGKIVVLT